MLILSLNKVMMENVKENLHFHREIFLTWEKTKHDYVRALVMNTIFVVISEYRLVLF